MAHFNCPECGAVLEYPEHGAGSIVRCRTCRQLVLLTRPATPTPAPSVPLTADPAAEKQTEPEAQTEPQASQTSETSTAPPAPLSPLAQAHDLMQSCRFAEAADLLAATPRERKQPQLTSLLMHVQYLRGLREAAHESLQRPGDATADVERYLKALQSENLRDSELELQIHRIRQATNPRGRELMLLLALAAALALLAAIWQAFFGEPVTSHPSQPEATQPENATAPRTAHDRFANALNALRAGHRSEAAASWASALAVSRGDESADCLENFLQQEKSRLASLSPAEQKAAIDQLQQLDQLASSGSGTLRVRLVRCELLQMAADLLIANDDPGNALELLQTAARLAPASPRTGLLAGKAIARMIRLGATGDPRFPSEIVIPVIDRAETAGLPAADVDKLRDLFADSQRQTLDAFLQTPQQTPLPTALDAFQRLKLEGDLPRGFTNAAAFSAAFDAAMAARIRGDLEAGRLADALLALQRLRKIHGTLPERVLNSLRMCPRSQLLQLPELLRNSLLVRTSTLGQRFQLIEPGQFTDGTDAARTTVTLRHWYYLAETELTRGQYKAVTGTLPDAPQSGDSETSALSDACPILLTWDQALDFCRSLSDRPEEQQRGQTYRLATEAEWEFACRAGSSGPWCFGQQPERLPLHAWYQQNSGGTLQEVARLQASPWGLFDQHGNAEEWVLDWFAPLPPGPRMDPQGPESGTLRVVRGGSWVSEPSAVSVQARRGLDPATGQSGVRLVQELTATQPLRPDLRP
ncbi:MAG: SUMF1/EgtB/PvdO family nonheme iron enzyme [Planctomycetaceae bacterium]